MGDNELRYILWRSHQNLVNPGWFNVFGQAEDIAKQYELGVGNYQTENGALPSVAEATAPLGQGSSLAAEDEMQEADLTEDVKTEDVNQSGENTEMVAEGGNAPGQSGVPVNEEVGPFGRIYRQFKGKAKEAIQFLLGKKDGEAVGALSHPEIGDIDLVWGEEGTSNSDGYGLAKLAKYHPEVLDNLQEIINDMRVTKRSANRVQLESDTHQAAVRLTWDNKSKNWLLTAFEKKNSVSDNTTDTGETSDGGKQNDTATLQNTVSTDEGTTQSANAQENTQKSGEEIQEPRSVEEVLENGDAMRNIFETVEEQETEEGDVVLYRSAERAGRKINKHAEEFNKTHKGGVPVVDIDPNNIDAELAEEGFTAEEIQELKERIKKGVAAVYNTDKKIIYLLVPSQDKESVYSTCWHEDTHAAIDFLGLTPEMMDEFYSFAQGKKKDAFEALLDKIGYEIEEYPEESLAYGVQAMHILDNWGAETLSKLFGSTAEGAQRQMEIIQPLIDYINNGRQGTQSSVGETVRDRGMHNNTANQKKTAETEGTGATATGGLTEEEIAMLEASTGYSRDEIIEIFGDDLARQGSGPLTDREVVMESDPYSKVLGKPR